jgi:hypothetical protein
MLAGCCELRWPGGSDGEILPDGLAECRLQPQRAITLNRLQGLLTIYDVTDTKPAHRSQTNVDYTSAQTKCSFNLNRELLYTSIANFQYVVSKSEESHAES